jgi:hypothetical protein
MVVAGVWLLSASASAAYVPAAVMCAPGVTRETDAILPMHLYNQTRLRPQDLEVIAGITDAVWRRYQVLVVLAGPTAAVLGSAERLAAGRPGERDFSEFPTNAQNLRLSRILGVSLAHEIGHYLLDGAFHSTRGLLRATMSTLQMLDPRLKDLGLDDEQIASLCEKLVVRRGRAHYRAREPPELLPSNEWLIRAH